MTIRVDITERDILIFKLLNKFRVLDAELIMKFLDSNDLRYTQRRLNVLHETKYIGRERDGNTTPYIYFLRNKGMNILNEKNNQNERPYIIRNFSKSSITHELMVADVCHEIMTNNPSLSLDDIQTDRELRKLGFNPDKVADLRIFKFKINIEIENTQKTFKRYPKKFSFNEDGFGQLWILNGFGTLKHKLNDYIKLYVTDRYVEAILLEEVPFYDFDLTRHVELYQKQQQFKFDEIERQREENIREAEERRLEKQRRAEREQRLIEEQQKKPFWKR